MPIAPDDPRLTALALGELEDQERAEVEALIARRPRGPRSRRRDPGHRPAAHRTPPCRGHARPGPRTSSGDRDLPANARRRGRGSEPQAPKTLGRLRRRRRVAGPGRDGDRPRAPAGLHEARARDHRHEPRRHRAGPRKEHRTRGSLRVGREDGGENSHEEPASRSGGLEARTAGGVGTGHVCERGRGPLAVSGLRTPSRRTATVPSSRRVNPRGSPARPERPAGMLTAYLASRRQGECPLSARRNARQLTTTPSGSSRLHRRARPTCRGLHPLESRSIRPLTAIEEPNHNRVNLVPSSILTSTFRSDGRPRSSLGRKAVGSGTTPDLKDRAFHLSRRRPAP